MNLLLMGAPGAGKGTVSKFILDDYNVVHISTGDMLRDAIAKKTPLGLSVEKAISNGELVSDEIITELIKEKLNENIDKDGFILDGYPRTLKQAESLTEILNDLGKKIDACINVCVNDELLIKRIDGRRICPNCGASFNVYFKLPKVEGVCDKCSSALTRRPDDNEASFKVRLEAYHNNSKPVIEYYDKMGVVVNIDGNSERSKVYEDVRKVLEGIK